MFQFTSCSSAFWQTQNLLLCIVSKDSRTLHNKLIKHQSFYPPARPSWRFFGILLGIPTVDASPSVKILISL